jgi:hypothetical protein
VQTAKEENNMSKQKPTHEARLGRVRAAVWENKSENGTRWYNVTFSRLYKDESGKWSDAAGFGRDDLPLLSKLADEVHTWIYTQGNGQGEEAQAANG